MSHDPPHFGDPSLDEGNPRDERIGELLNDFFDRQQRGEAVSIEDFAAAYPEFAAELRQQLSGLKFLTRRGSSTDADQTQVVTPGSGSSAGRMRPISAAIPLPQIDGYEVQREIGRGGMGVVFKALQRSTKRTVALKVLLEGPFASDSAQRRFEREVELAAQLRHPNIVPIYDSGNCGGRMYYAMEYVHGRPLSDHIARERPALRDRLQLFQKLCNAISHAHLRGVIHRDLKPANVIVDAEGEPRVLDFGLAKAGGMRDANMSLTAQIVGTPAYMAPEQVGGDPTAIDPRTDVYALGVMLYDLVCGKMPYPTNGALSEVLHNIVHAEPISPAKHSREASGDIGTIVLKALAKRKDERYQSVAALCDDIGRYLAGEPIEARRANPFYLLGRVLWLHRFATAAVVAIALLSITVVAVMWRGAVRDHQRELELAQSRQREAEAKVDAERRAAVEREKANQQVMEFVMKKAGELPPEMARQFMSDAQTLLRGMEAQNPKDVLLRGGATLLGQLGQSLEASRSTATQPAGPTSAPVSESP